MSRPIAIDLSPAMLFPWRLGSPTAWKAEHRRAQSDLLTMALTDEQAAVSSLEHALIVLGVVVPDQ